MNINKVEAKSIITLSKLPVADFVINPYVGCQHGCIYCYADFMSKYTNHSEEWGQYVDVKINAPDLIKHSERYKDKKIFLSSVTDSYMPLEHEHKITRSILKKLIFLNIRLEILTKSKLILKDLDLIKKFTNPVVGFSMSTIHSNLCRILEPRASLANSRIEALKKCHGEGISTYVFLSPIFPEITEIEKIIDNTYEYVDYFMFENLNIRKNNKEKIFNFISIHRPELMGLYQDIYSQKQKRMAYWSKIKNRILDLCNKKNIPARIYFQRVGVF